MDDRAFFRRLLEQELVLSTGCTEPAAIALVCAAAARRAGGGRPLHLAVRVDPGTLKNSLAVGLPGTDLRGPAVAAAVGAILGRIDAGLDILGLARKANWAAAGAIRDRVRIGALTGAEGVRLEATVETETGRGSAEIRYRHDGIVGEPVGDGDEAPIPDGEIRDRLASAADLTAAEGSLLDEDLEPVRRALEVNRRLAERSLEEGLGLGFGRGLRDGAESDPLRREVRSWVAAGIEARMAGESYAVMTSGGSGNSGLTVSLGSWAAAEALGIGDPALRDRATALAHLTNIAAKVRIGRVGPLCGGVLASSLGVGAAVVHLLGGGTETLDRMLRLAVDGLAGVVCDGAKPKCAVKVAAGLSWVLEAARLATADFEQGPGGLGGRNSATALEHLEALVHGPLAAADPGLIRILRADRPRERVY